MWILKKYHYKFYIKIKFDINFERKKIKIKLDKNNEYSDQNYYILRR